MRCPYCSAIEDKVVDSRETVEAETVRRRRECLKCGHRFTTYERIEQAPFMVIKKDGRREVFDRQKVLNGLSRACEKRPISPTQIEQIANKVEQYVQNSQGRECPTKKIGEIIMRELKKLDQVAYVRFASVYLEFKDVGDFMTELRQLAGKGHKSKKAAQAES